MEHILTQEELLNESLVNRDSNKFLDIIHFEDGHLHNLYDDNKEIEKLMLDNNLSDNDIDPQYYSIYNKDKNPITVQINKIRGKIYFDALTSIKEAPTNLKALMELQLDQGTGVNYVYIINFKKPHFIYKNKKIKLPKNLTFAVADMNDITTVSLDNKITEDHKYIDSESYNIQNFSKAIKNNNLIEIAILYSVLHLEDKISQNLFSIPNPYYQALIKSKYDYDLIINMDQFDFFK